MAQHYKLKHMCSKRIQRLVLAFWRLRQEAVLLRWHVHLDVEIILCCAKSEKQNRFIELLSMIDAAVSHELAVEVRASLRSSDDRLLKGTTVRLM